MHALECAGRRAPLLRVVLTLEIFHRVLFERDAGCAALLRAPVNQTVLADVQVARTGAAAPFVRLTVSNGVLKPVEARVVAVAEFLDLLKNLFLTFTQRLQCSVVIVYDADRA